MPLQGGMRPMLCAVELQVASYLALEVVVELPADLSEPLALRQAVHSKSDIRAVFAPL